MSDKTLILGLGNILMGDEGIGVKSIEYMQEKPFPEHVTLLRRRLDFELKKTALI